MMWKWHRASFLLSYVTLCYPILPFFPSLFKTHEGDSSLLLKLSDSLTAPAACLLVLFYSIFSFCSVFYCISIFLLFVLDADVFFSLASCVSYLSSSNLTSFSLTLSFLCLCICDRSGNIHLIGHCDLTKDVFGRNSRIHGLIMAKFHKNI